MKNRKGEKESGGVARYTNYNVLSNFEKNTSSPKAKDNSINIRILLTRPKTYGFRIYWRLVEDAKNM